MESSSSSSSFPSPETAHLPFKSHVLQGDYCVCAIDHVDKLRQLEALPISTHGGNFDIPIGSPSRIIVNGSYICYSPHLSGSVGILGRNVASHGLFQGHASTVSDMGFCAEREDLVASVSSDGSLFVWRIVEKPDAHDDFQLHEQVTLAIHFQGPWKDLQPRVCWQPSSQECLAVSISDRVFTVDIKEAQVNSFNLGLLPDALVYCQSANLIDGVHLIGQHDAEVTSISMFSRQSLYIASASRDGMVKIWQGSDSSSLAVLTPYEGQPIDSAIFFSSPQEPNKAILLTQAVTHEKLKLWVPETSSTGMDKASWSLIQTLEFTIPDEVDVKEQKPVNQICPVQEAGLLIFGSSRTSIIYSIHLGFEEASGALRMDYLTQFSVPMPILSLAAMANTGSDLNKGTIEVLCVHTQAIHEYHLSISYLLPHVKGPDLVPTNISRVVREDLEKNSMDSAERSNKPGPTANDLIGCLAVEGNVGSTSEHDSASAHSGSGFGSWVEVPSWVAATIKKGIKVGHTETTHDKQSPLASRSGSGSVMSSEEEASTTNTALPGCKESAHVLGEISESVEETGQAAAEMYELAGNGVEKNDARVFDEGENSMQETVVENTCRSGEAFMQVSPGPPNNPLEDLSVHISAMQESIDLLLTSQMELQRNLCSVLEASLAEEMGHMDLSVEERLKSYCDTCLVSFWRQLDTVKKDCTIPLYDKCVYTIEKEITKIGPRIGEIITKSTEDIITSAVAHMIKGRHEKIFKSVEASVRGILKSSVKAHMESVFLTNWNHLMQDELCSCLQQQALLRITQSCANAIEKIIHLLYEGTIQALVIVEQQLTSKGLAFTSSLKETLCSLLSMASALKHDLHDAERKALQAIKHSYVRQDIHEELRQLLHRGQMEEAFALALSLRNDNLVSWLCKQVNPRALFSGNNPPPWLSQGLILALVEQLARDLGSNSAEKLAWMEQACLALDLNDDDDHHRIWHVHTSLRHVYTHVQQQVHLFNNDTKLLNQLRLIMHIVNSLMAFCTEHPGTTQPGARPSTRI